MDGLGQTKLVNASLQTTFEEILHLEGQDVIELHAGLVEHTNTDETTDEGISFEETLGIFLLEGEKFTSSSTNLGQSQLDAPHLALVLETILADGLQFGITTKLDTAIRDLSLHEAETQWPAMKQREIFKHTDEQIQRDDGGRGRSLSNWG